MKNINRFLQKSRGNALITTLLCVLASCSFSVNDKDCLKGEGDRISDEREVVDFDKLNLAGMQQLHITQGTAYALKIDAPSDLMEMIHTEVVDGVLKIWDEPCLADPEQVQIHLTLPSLKSIIASGVGTIETVGEFEADVLELQVQGATAIKMNLNANALKVIAPGATSMEFSGGCEMLDINTTGAVNIDAQALRASNVRIVMSGASNCKVHPIDMLDATINGMGLVEYYGNPEVKQQINGIGKIKKAGGEDEPKPEA